MQHAHIASRLLIPTSPPQIRDLRGFLSGFLSENLLIIRPRNHLQISAPARRPKGPPAAHWPKQMLHGDFVDRSLGLGIHARNLHNDEIGSSIIIVMK